MNFRWVTRSVFYWIETTLGAIVLERILARLMTRDNIVAVLNGILDFFEQYAQRTETTLDDKFLRALRDALDIPDTHEHHAPKPPPEN